MSAPSLAELLDLERMGVCESTYENNIHNYNFKHINRFDYNNLFKAYYEFDFYNMLCNFLKN